MRWPARHVALAMFGGSIGGGVASLVHDWVLGLALWSPGRLGIALLVGALIGFLCTRLVRPNDL
jgi:hypothetical protein